MRGATITLVHRRQEAEVRGPQSHSKVYALFRSSEIFVMHCGTGGVAQLFGEIGLMYSHRLLKGLLQQI